MKHLFLSIAILLSTVFSFAQYPGGGNRGAGGRSGMNMNVGHFYGKFVDATTNKPIDGVSVLLYGNIYDSVTKSKKEVVLKTVITSNNGDFTFDGLAIVGTYKLKALSIGYKDFNKTLKFDIKFQQMGADASGDGMQKMIGMTDVDLGNLKLQTNPNDLANVTVTASKQLFEMGIDRKVFNVDKNLVSTGQTATEIMKTIPSLSVDVDGNITGFKGAVINQSITRGTFLEGFMFKNGIDDTQKEGFANHPYKVASHELKSFCPQSPIPVLWLRSVGHTTSAPLVENIIDQAAVALNMDPIDFRIKNMKEPRYNKLLENVAKQSNWYKREKNSGYGVAIAESFGSIVAYVVKVKVENNDYKVQNVWAAVDCGMAINPLGIENQIEGSINFTIGYIKSAQITLTNGAVDQNNFYDYEVNRITDAPESIKVEIINSGEKIGGVGEIGVPPMFAAVINALADATGKRYTKFPIKLG